MVARGLPFLPSLCSLTLAAILQASLKEKGQLWGGSRGGGVFPGPGKGSFPVGTTQRRLHPGALPRRPGPPAQRRPAARTAAPQRGRADGREGACARGPPAPPGRGRPAPALTQAAPAQRAVAAVQDGTELAQQRGRQVEQQGVHRERAAGPAGPRRRAGHGSAARDQGPGGGGMRGPDLCTPARGRYTTAEILLHGCGQDCRTRRTQVLEGAGPA